MALVGLWLPEAGRSGALKLGEHSGWTTKHCEFTKEDHWVKLIY